MHFQQESHPSALEMLLALGALGLARLSPSVRKVTLPLLPFLPLPSSWGMPTRYFLYRAVHDTSEFSPSGVDPPSLWSLTSLKYLHVSHDQLGNKWSIFVPPPLLDFMFNEVIDSILFTNGFPAHGARSSQKQTLNLCWMGGRMDRGWMDDKVLGKDREKQKTVETNY